MSNSVNSLSMLAAAPTSSNYKSGNSSSSWYEAMAEAWGQTLDGQAGKIEELSNSVSDGMDTPSTITTLTAESLKMGFMSNSSHTSLNSIGSALETMARKQ